jgi:hypothetical protein
MNEEMDQRTIKDLAIEVLSIQDAVNICGLAGSFSRSMKRLLRITESTAKTNKHVITRAWISKFDSLAGSMTSADWNELQDISS